ncbi:MAG: signal peptidase I [Ignavibacteria bacterium]|nr:signal peptidase I [Ignavibacteria bacterium]
MTDNKNNLFHKYREYRKKRKAELEAKKPLTVTESILSWIKTFVGALVFVMILHSLLIASFIVPTGSMENTVMTGDFLLVNKKFGPSTPQIIPFFNIPLPYAMLPSPCEPHKGDVIVFVFPGMRDEVEAKEFQYYLKRCVGEPGDTLQIRDNVLYVNGKKQPLAPKARFENDDHDDAVETYHTFPINATFTHRNYGPIRIPKKGDTIHLRTTSEYENWAIFIQREGHYVEWNGHQATIDDNASNIYIVEEDYYFGMGDNRDRSLDSRYWGFIPRDAILGSPIICWLSWNMYDEYNNELDIFHKFANIRWNRIGHSID